MPSLLLPNQYIMWVIECAVFIEEKTWWELPFETQENQETFPSCRIWRWRCRLSRLGWAFAAICQRAHMWGQQNEVIICLLVSGTWGLAIRTSLILEHLPCYMLRFWYCACIYWPFATSLYTFYPLGRGTGVFPLFAGSCSRMHLAMELYCDLQIPLAKLCVVLASAILLKPNYSFEIRFTSNWWSFWTIVSLICFWIMMLASIALISYATSKAQSSHSWGWSGYFFIQRHFLLTERPR